MSGHATDEFTALLALALAGDLIGIRSKVAAGYDLTTRDADGTPLLEQVIAELHHLPDLPKHAIVKALLDLGADARQRSPDGFRPLFEATLGMDTEMMRILIDAGTDPNEDQMDSEGDSLYDWAEDNYRYRVWNVNGHGTPDNADKTDEDSWLGFLDRMAVLRGKRRPDHLMLLRERGALRMAELSELPGSPHFGVMDKYRNRFEMRIDATNNTSGNETYTSAIVLTIVVDGEDIEPQQYVDVFALRNSLRSSGRFEIFVCACASTRTCGATFHGVQVTQCLGGIVRWRLPRPQLFYTADAPYDGCFGPAVESTFLFKRSQIVAALRSYLDALAKIVAGRPGAFELPIDGQAIDDVLRICMNEEPP